MGVDMGSWAVYKLCQNDKPSGVDREGCNELALDVQGLLALKQLD